MVFLLIVGVVIGGGGGEVVVVVVLANARLGMMQERLERCAVFIIMFPFLLSSLSMLLLLVLFLLL